MDTASYDAEHPKYSYTYALKLKEKLYVNKKISEDKTYSLTNPDEICPNRYFNPESATGCVQDGADSCKLSKISCEDTSTVTITTPETSCPGRAVTVGKEDFKKFVAKDASSCELKLIDCKDTNFPIADPATNCAKRYFNPEYASQCFQNGNSYRISIIYCKNNATVTEPSTNCQKKRLIVKITKNVFHKIQLHVK